MSIPLAVIRAEKGHNHGFEYPIYSFDGISLWVIRRDGSKNDAALIGKRLQCFINELCAVIREQEFRRTPARDDEVLQGLAYQFSVRDPQGATFDPLDKQVLDYENLTYYAKRVP